MRLITYLLFLAIWNFTHTAQSQEVAVINHHDELIKSARTIIPGFEVNEPKRRRGETIIFTSGSNRLVISITKFPTFKVARELFDFPLASGHTPSQLAEALPGFQGRYLDYSKLKRSSDVNGFTKGGWVLYEIEGRQVVITSRNVSCDEMIQIAKAISPSVTRIPMEASWSRSKSLPLRSLHYIQYQAQSAWAK